MKKGNPIFYSTILLTGANFLLRLAGISFQVYLSNRIGAAGIGLLLLVGGVSAFRSIWHAAVELLHRVKGA